MNPADRRYGADSDDSPLRDLDNYRLHGMDLTHQPARPTWDCSACGQEWPCDPAREQLIQQTGGGTALAIAAWGYLDDWVRDRGEGPFLEAFERFLHWTRSSTFG